MKRLAAALEEVLQQHAAYVIHDAAVTVLVEQLADQAHVGVDLLLLLNLTAQDGGNIRRVEILRALGFAQRAHDNGRAHGHQIAGLVVVQAAHLADDINGSTLTAAEDVPQNAGAIGSFCIGSLVLAGDHTHDIIQDTAVVIAVQGAGQGACAFR